MAPLFSVIVPTKGRAEKLARALASVTAQTDGDLEIVVVDDGSDPADAARIAEVVQGTRTARLLRNDVSLGAPAARNRAVADSRGAIIATLDSDDWWEPDRLSRHRAAHASPGTVLSYNPARMVGEDGTTRRIICSRPLPFPDRPALSLAAWNVLGGCSSVCMDRARFDAVGGFDETLPSCQDWDLWYRMGRDGGRVAFVDAPVTFQDWGGHERISTSRDKVMAGHDRLFARITERDWSPADRRHLAAHHQRVRARLEMDLGNGGRAIAMTARSLALRPTREGFGDLVSFGKDYARSLARAIRS